MNKFGRCSILLFFFIGIPLVFHASVYGWGFFAHKWIMQLAVDALPLEMRPFFQDHKDFLAEHSIDPDLWREIDPDEFVKHYIDIDLYGSYPFNELPRSFSEAIKVFSEDSVKSRGIAPWIVIERFEALVAAMKKNKKYAILANAAALGHYLSDLHVPLHTVENYDGQLTGNDGIHARFERSMIEKHSDKIEPKVQEARMIQEPLSFVFQVVLDSYLLVEKILNADTHSKKAGSENVSHDSYDDEYYSSLFAHSKLIAEKRIAASAHALASFWYTAWIKAGKPVLEN